MLLRLLPRPALGSTLDNPTPTGPLSSSKCQSTSPHQCSSRIVSSMRIKQSFSHDPTISDVLLDAATLICLQHGHTQQHASGGTTSLCFYTLTCTQHRTIIMHASPIQSEQRLAARRAARAAARRAREDEHMNQDDSIAEGDCAVRSRNAAALFPHSFHLYYFFFA